METKKESTPEPAGKDDTAGNIVESNPIEEVWKNRTNSTGIGIDQFSKQTQSLIRDVIRDYIDTNRKEKLDKELEELKENYLHRGYEPLDIQQKLIIHVALKKEEFDIYAYVSTETEHTAIDANISQADISYIRKSNKKEINEKGAIIKSEANTRIAEIELSKKPEDIPVPEIPESEEQKELRRLEDRIGTYQNYLDTKNETLELSKELELGNQIEIHEVERDLAEKELKAVMEGYMETHWDNDNYDRSTALDRYNDEIPRNIMRKLQEAQQKNIFDKFVVWWNEDSDPVLIGKVVVKDRHSDFEIGDW